MDAFERCSKKLDDINKRLCAQLDQVAANLREIRRYNQQTAFIVLVLWGFGLPLTFLGAVIWIARTH